MILIHNGKNIVNRYHGERPLMAKYHGDKLVWLKENDWRNQYQQVEYISTTGNSYFLADFVPTSQSRLETTFRYTGPANPENNKMVAGGMGTLNKSTTVNRFYAGLGTIGSSEFVSGFGDERFYKGNADSEIHTIVSDIKNSKGTIDGTEQTGTANWRNIQSKKIGVGTYTNNSGEFVASSAFIGEIYEIRCYENDEIKNNLVPVYRRKDGVAGMYDIVNKKFYKSETSTEFNAGKEIVGRLPYGFTEIEYIESNQGQRTQLDYSSNVNDELSIKFEFSEKAQKIGIVGCELQYSAGQPQLQTTRLGAQSEKSGSTALYWYAGVYYRRTYQLDKNPGDLINLSAPETNTIYNVVMTSSKINVNGKSYNLLKEASETKQTKMYLFADNYRAREDMEFTTKGKIYYLGLKRNGKQLFDLVPCIRESDGVAGMYDMIGGKFYKSETETEFNAGRKVIVRLPEEYQEVEYIEGAGNSYINLGLLPKTTHSFSSKFIVTDKSVANNMIIGTRGSGNFDTSRNQIYMNRQKVDKQVVLRNIYNVNDVKIEEKTEGFYRFQDAHNTSTVLEGTTVPYYLFAINKLGTADAIANLKMYYFTIKDNGKIIRNFIPCIRKKDGIAGMYDTIGKKFYKSETSTEFVAGPIASGEQLEFISNDNLNYIDTGLKLTSNHSVKLDYQYLQYNSGIFYGGRGKNTDISKPSTETSPAYIIGVANDSEAENFDVCEIYAGAKRYQQAFNTERRTVEMDNSKIAINGTIKKNFQKEVFESKVNAYIFSNPYCLVGSETKPGIVKSKVYEITVKDNKSQVLQSLLPCKINGEIGLLDTVSKVFFTGELYGKPFVSTPEQITTQNETDEETSDNP